MLSQAKQNGWSPHCEGRAAIFADYEDPPAPEKAKELCAGCPMLMLCKSYAQETKVAWGVWGGIAWNQGRQLPLRVKKNTDLNLISNYS